MHNHLALLREHGLGSYRDLLMGVSKDPAMLIWLDGNTNRKVAPNENYGRELLELFTLGIGNYTEDDVAAARAFTGWNLQDGAFFFNRSQHDFGPKTFLGQTGPFDGGDDGLNVLVPYGNGTYYDLRPKVAIPQADVLPFGRPVPAC